MGPFESGGEDFGVVIDLRDPIEVMTGPPQLPVLPDLDPSGFVVEWQIEEWESSASDIPVAAGAPEA